MIVINWKEISLENNFPFTSYDSIQLHISVNHTYHTAKEPFSINSLIKYTEHLSNVISDKFQSTD